MPFYRMPNGMSVHINMGGRKNAPPPCHAERERGTICAWMAPYLCDWKIAGKHVTCDRPICEHHAFEIAPDKHLCPEHVQSYRAWLREQCIPC